MLLTMHVVNSNGECASPHYDNTVQPRLSRFLDYPNLFLCSKFFVNINLFYFVSTAKLFSFKLCTMWPEFIALQSTNLYTFWTLTDRVHFTELWLAKICSVAEGNFTYSSLNYSWSKMKQPEGSYKRRKKRICDYPKEKLWQSILFSHISWQNYEIC